MLKLLEEEVTEGFGNWRDRLPRGRREPRRRPPLTPHHSPGSTRLQPKPQPGFAPIQTEQL